jgi:hypothetical protein
MTPDQAYFTQLSLRLGSLTLGDAPLIEDHLSALAGSLLSQ